jgi:NADH-quinone oxidoreductase subunit L
MSQIGYMFVGAGIGAYPSAMLHLMTHAFYKALLFLTAGLIIHALSGEQDIRRMGGLGRAMPMTRVAFLIGALALVGVPPFSGFFSKDSIIAATLTRGAFGDCLFAACVAGSFLTGVYIFRLYFIVFSGERSGFAREHLHPRTSGWEGPVSMVWTVCVLAVGATFAGFLQFGGVWHPLTTWLDPVAAPIVDPSPLEEALGSLAAVALGVAGIWVAYALYRAHTRKVPRTLPLLEHKFYWDELYDAVFARPAVAAAVALNRFVERPLIAGSITELARGFRTSAGDLGRLQNGLVRTYALALTGGVALLAVVFLATR